MNLQEHIRKVLKEESKIPLRLRRRMFLIDDLLTSKVNYFYKPNVICRYENGEELVEVIMYSVIDTMYYDYFGDIDDNSEEWRIMFESMEKYIKDKYSDSLIRYYHTNCGD